MSRLPLVKDTAEKNFLKAVTSGVAAVVVSLSLICTQAGGAASEKSAEPAGWKLAFSDNFERPLLGSDWVPLSGTWSIEKGELRGKGEILCAWRLPGPQRLEYDARSRDISPVGDHQACDLSAVLFTDPSGIHGGYFFGFGSNNNTRSKLWVRGKEIASYGKTIALFNKHHVVCEFDGARLSHQIDGEVVHSQEADEKLTGFGHEQVGFYLWLPGFIDNVRVYTRTGEAVRPQKRSISLTPPPDPGLIKNGSFENILPVGRPRVPTNWIAEGWTRDDRVELVTHAAEANRGQRFLRASAPGEHGIRMHSVQQGLKTLEPGSTYLIRLWARQTSRAEATLSIQPGDYQAELTRSWQLHEVRYSHPAGAKPELGMFFEIKGGPADVDDVSMATEGEPEPVALELQSDWSKLTRVPADDGWRQSPEEPAYQERIPIVVRETGGKPAYRHAVSLSLKTVFRAYNYDFVSTKKIQVVDSAAKGAPAVPWGLVVRHPEIRTDPYHAGAEDLLIFLVDIPALSEKTYYVYLENRRHAEPFAISDRIPAALNIPPTYPHALSTEVGDTQRPLSASVRMDGDVLRAEIRGRAAERARARVVSPSGNQSIEVPLKSSGRYRWAVSPGWRFPERAPEGVWQLSATFTDESGALGKAESPFVYGNALWCDSNTRRIFPDDPPRYGRSTVRIAAARNEWEAFQVVVASSQGLKKVKLRPTDLTHAGGKAKIAAGQITVELQAHSFLFSNSGFRSGPTPAPLLPWREKDVPAGSQAVAWVTVRVPGAVPAGLYTGAIRAEGADGWRGDLPVELELFDFSLPSAYSFTPLIGCNVKHSILRENMPEDWDQKLAGDKHFSYAKANRFPVPTSLQQTVLDLYRYFGQRHITPTVGGLLTNFGRTYTAATYHPSQKTVEIDFSGIDAIIDLIEQEQLDVKFLVHTGGNRVRGDPKQPGWIALNNSEEGRTIYGFHGRPEGDELFRLWLTALRDDLRPKGWSARTVFYTNDESFGVKTNYGTVSELVTVYNRMIHKVAPEFRTFCADNAGKRWSEGLDGTDFFTGAINKENLKRFRDLGNTWWGLYNRPLTMNRPLGNARIIGLDCWLRGWKYQWQYHSTHWNQSFWFNPSPLYYYPANAKYPDKFFVKSQYMAGFYMIYPWPSRRGPAWIPGQPSFAGSTHVEAIRESAEDYEYITMLEALAGRAKDGSRQQHECRELLDKVRSFVKGANQGNDHRWGGSHSDFVVDGDELQALRRKIGRTIAARTETKKENAR